MEYELFTETLFGLHHFPISDYVDEHLEIFDRHLDFAEKYLTPKNFMRREIFDIEVYEYDVCMLKYIFKMGLSTELYEIAMKNFDISKPHVEKLIDGSYVIDYYYISAYFRSKLFEPKKYNINYTIHM